MVRLSLRLTGSLLQKRNKENTREDSDGDEDSEEEEGRKKKKAKKTKVLFVLGSYSRCNLSSFLASQGR